MSRERALKIRAIILDNAKKQIAASMPARALQTLMPEALDHLLQHIAGNSAMEIDCTLDDEPDQYERAASVAAGDHRKTS